VIRGWRTFIFGLGEPPLRQVVGERGVVLMGLNGHVWKGRTCHATCSPWVRRPDLEKTGSEPAIVLERLPPDGRLARRHLESGECRCGVYLRSEPDPEWMSGVFSCLAEVVAWGRVAHYSDGFRAEAVRIEKLWDCPRLEVKLPALWDVRNTSEAFSYQIMNVRPFDLCAALAGRYGVPVASGSPPALEEVLDLAGQRLARVNHVRRLFGRGALGG
jgi:hypothetical protein